MGGATWYGSQLLEHYCIFSENSGRPGGWYGAGSSGNITITPDRVADQFGFNYRVKLLATVVAGTTTISSVSGA